MAPHKFTFSSRQSEGVKLGGIAAKRLRKGIAVTGSHQEACSRAVELTFANKKLGDDGLAIVIEALLEVLVPAKTTKEIAKSTTTAITKTIVLQELNLSGTGITVNSLPALAKVIQLSAGHLRDLDISNNLISVETDQDVRCWESLLQSFRTCHVMYRLVVSGNDLSNQLAWETMARVYSQHPAIDEDDMRHDSIQDSLLSHNASTNGNKERRNSTKERRNSTKEIRCSSIIDSKAAVVTMGPCGLRSIPYIVLQNTGINSYGILWLSYIIQHHPMPAIRSPVKSSPISSAIAEYEKLNCQGIVYHPNQELINGGAKVQELLTAAESERISQSSMMMDDDEATPSSPTDEDDLESLSRLRRKFEREALERQLKDIHGERNIKLWTAGLKLVVLTRLLLNNSTKEANTTGLGKIWNPSFKDLFSDDDLKHTQSDVQAKILRQAADPWSILEDKMVERAIEYGKNPLKLEDEMGNRAKDDAWQIWHVLYYIGCLQYTF